ncbi:MAG: tetratricopeptide repeat protein [Deltaproteobacteria bacterium]|nr:MAG: tetratricopeptide repeat protein [Deltaproteobacteria bacterium]
MRSALSLGTATLLLLGVACEDPALRALDEAQEASYRGDHERAKAILDASLESLRSRTDPEGLAARRRTLLLAGRTTQLFLRKPREALAYFERLADEFPEADETFEARVRMAEILSQDLGDRRGALAQWKALVASFPKRPETDLYQYQVVRTLFALGDYGPAHTEARILRERFPDSEYIDDVRMLEGQALASMGQCGQAMETFQKVIDSGSELAPRAKVEIADCLETLGRDKEALQIYLEALESHPEPRIVQMKIDRLQRRLRRK